MDDHEIIRRAQAGDRQAFGVLFDTYYPRVYRYLNEKLGGAPEAEDLCQEVFLTVLGSIDEYRCDGVLGFDEWLLRVARRLASEHYRSRGRERRVQPAPRPVRVSIGRGSFLRSWAPGASAASLPPCSPTCAPSARVSAPPTSARPTPSSP